MDVQIIHQPLTLELHGFSGIATDGDYAGTAFRLMDKMWKIVKSNGLKNKGMNIWVYEPDHSVFAGVELEDMPGPSTELERKTLKLKKYAYYKHIGPYKLIPATGTEMRDEIRKKGFETDTPYIEIYGHWTNDESKLETELLICLK